MERKGYIEARETSLCCISNMEGDVFDFPGEEGSGNDLVPSREAHVALREGKDIKTLLFWGKVSRDVLLCFEKNAPKGCLHLRVTQ